MRLAVLTGLYVGVVCAAQIGAQKIIELPFTGDAAPGGAYLIGVALALIELGHRTAPTRREGWRNAQVMVACGFGASALLALYIKLIDSAQPAFPGQTFHDIADTWRIVAASLAAFAVSNTLDNAFGAWLRGRVHDGIARAGDECGQRPHRQRRLPGDRLRLTRLPARPDPGQVRGDAADRAAARARPPALGSAGRAQYRCRAGMKQIFPSSITAKRRELRRGRQRPRPLVRQGRPVHARRRGGVHAPRLQDVRPRPAHRHVPRRGRRPRARGADEGGADAVGARDRDSGVQDAGGRRPASSASSART